MIHILLADAAGQLPEPAGPAAVGWWIIILFGVCGGCYYVQQMVNGFRGKDPHPPNESLGLSVKELERRVNLAEAAISGVRSEMAAAQNKLEDSARVRSAGLYRRIEDVRIEINNSQSSIRNQVEHGFKDVERAIGRLEGKIEK